MWRGEYLSLEPTSVTGVALVRINDQRARVNSVTTQMINELVVVLDKIDHESTITAVVLMSAKPGCFIAGGDLSFVRSCSSEAELKKFSQHSQTVMQRIASSTKLFIAAINGVVSGNGLELAMACHYRIATRHKKTILGMPEVQLGLTPGAGGTQWLPRIVGLQASLEMLLTGKRVTAEKAKKMGLVDELVMDSSTLEHEAIAVVQQLMIGERNINRTNSPNMSTSDEDVAFRAMVFQSARDMAKKASRGRYPAPALIVEAVQVGLDDGLSNGFEVEAKNFAKAAVSHEAKALMGISVGQAALKKNRYGKPKQPVKSMAVIGAGLMGSGIAQVSAAANIRVLLKDRNATAAASGLNRIRVNLNQKVKRRAITESQRDAILSNVVPLSDEDDVWKHHMQSADLVIEAVFEDMELKHRVIQELEQYVPSDCVIATNTSALPIAQIAQASKRPENVIGMHYFSPVPSMRLLEIIRHAGTSDSVAARAVDVGLRQEKACIVVRDVPGFYVNRALAPYFAEVMALVVGGIDLERIDKLIRQWGLPVGPITLMDEVGLDVAAHVNQTMADALGIRGRGGDTRVFEEMIQQGFLGKKTGKGFFVHPKNKKEKKKVNEEARAIINKYQRASVLLSDEEVVNRVICRFVNEAIFCLQDDIIASPVEGDIGALFGIGFPPFIGGPFRFVDRIGSGTLNAMMLEFAAKYGQQFMPAPLLQEMAKTNQRFHDESRSFL